MVSLEKNDHLMLARQLPFEICCPDTGGRTWYPPEGFNQ